MLHGLTRNQIKEARAAQIQAEVLRSKELKHHFQEHPSDLEAISRKTAATAISKRPKMVELKKIPDYLRPTASDSNQIKRALGGAQPQRSRAPAVRGKKNRRKRGNDPLRTLQVKKK